MHAAEIQFNSSNHVSVHGRKDEIGGVAMVASGNQFGKKTPAARLNVEAEAQGTWLHALCLGIRSCLIAYVINTVTLLLLSPYHQTHLRYCLHCCAYTQQFLEDAMQVKCCHVLW